MQLHPEVPDPPPFGLEVVHDQSTDPGGYLRRLTRQVRVLSPEGSNLGTSIYDEVDRLALDAVVIAAHFRHDLGRGEEEFIVLRSAARPPVFFREQERSPLPEREHRSLWELPAGLVEPQEQSQEGLVSAAVRELHEETGFRVSPDELFALGPSSFPSPGMAAERHFFFRVSVQSKERREPPLDGSALELAGRVVAVPLRAALNAARQGFLEDAKTELGIRRLVEVLEINA